MTKSERLRRELVEQLRAAGAVRSDAVADAFLAVPRERFIPEAAKSEGLAAIYKDVPVPTKRDERGIPVSSSSQPAIMAQMLELLDLESGQRVLEIGTGTGYNAALLSTLVGPRGRVASVELDRGLAGLARTRLAEGGHRVRVAAGDGRRGFEGGAPYDRIIATASTVDVPVAWRDQLSGDGILVTPLRVGGIAAQVVTALRPTGSKFASITVVCGGFMGLRSSASDDAPLDPIDQVNVGWQVDGEHHYRSATGAAVARMTPAARRRLMTTLIDKPRAKRTQLVNPMAFAPYLAVAAPKRAVTWSSGQPAFASAIVLPDGRGIAGIETKGRSTRILAAGERTDDARAELRTVLDTFHRRGGDIDQLRIRAVPDGQAEVLRTQYSVNGRS